MAGQNKPRGPGRPKQQTPEAMVERLLHRIRRQFCVDLGEKEWFQDHYHFIKRNVVMWPAREICFKHGFTLSSERYERVMLAILAEVEAKGDIAEVRYWPAYLMKCVQSHWEHHWEEYYAEAKSIRNATEAAMVALGSLRTPEDRTVEAVAMAHRVLTASRKARKKPGPTTQLSLFDRPEK
jgi:hypothetical protein